MLREESQFLVLLLCLHISSVFGECGLERDCIKLRNCPVIMNQLRSAQAAKKAENAGAMNTILRAVKSTICDAASNTVCCPIYIGSITLESEAESVAEDKTTLSPIYAINDTTIRILDFPVQGEMDLAALEPYFWSDEECIPHSGFKILEESFNPEYSPENSFLDLNLPPSLTVRTLRCLAIWKKLHFIGYAHLFAPAVEVVTNKLQE